MTSDEASMLTGATRGATAARGAMKAEADVANAKIKAAARMIVRRRLRRGSNRASDVPAS